MSRREKLKMRDLDERIAVAFFRWHRIGEHNLLLPPNDDKRMGYVAEWDKNGRPNWLPKYTLYISDAFEILEKFDNYSIGKSAIGGAYYAHIGTTKREAESIPIAICVAALAEKENR